MSIEKLVKRTVVCISCSRISQQLARRSVGCAATLTLWRPIEHYDDERDA
jgi:hypothetical protein